MSSTFHPFPRLPKELRVLIWEAALPIPRIVDCCTTGLVARPSMDYRESARDSVPRLSRLSSSIHHVNSEARAIFLKRYQFVSVVGRDSGMIVVDFEHDLMYFDSTSFHNQRRILGLNDPGAGAGLNMSAGPDNALPNWRQRVMKVALNLKVFLHQTRQDEGFRELYFNPEQRALLVSKNILEVFPALEQLYLIIDGTDFNTASPRRMVDPLDFDQYVCWKERMGRHRAMNWIPETVQALQQKRQVDKPLQIALKLFVNRSSPCGMTNLYVVLKLSFD